jgi:hypothetical protein
MALLHILRPPLAAGFGQAAKALKLIQQDSIPCSVVVVVVAYRLRLPAPAAKALSVVSAALAPALLPTTAWLPAVVAVAATTA